MLHDLVFKDISRQITNDLVDIHHGIAGLIVFHAHGFNVGIQNAPLTSPIGAHFVASMHASTFHPVRPVHIRTHQRENPVNVPLVECRINGYQ